MYYRQCQLENVGEFFTLYTTSYIPEKFAVVGKVLSLKNGDVWSYGWKVIVAHSKVHEDNLPDPHKDIKGHRKMTGDSLLKSTNKLTKEKE